MMLNETESSFPVKTQFWDKSTYLIFHACFNTKLSAILATGLHDMMLNETESSFPVKTQFWDKSTCLTFPLHSPIGKEPANR